MNSDVRRKSKQVNTSKKLFGENPRRARGQTSWGIITDARRHPAAGSYPTAPQSAPNCII